MKSYTNIKQSKKLAEILPVESADQTWERIAIAGANLDVPEKMEYWHNGNTPYFLNSKIGIPCWSLAALTDIMRLDYYIVRTLDILTHRFTYSIHAGYFDIETDEYDELIDACVEMIYKLKENNLI